MVIQTVGCHDNRGKIQGAMYTKDVAWSKGLLIKSVKSGPLIFRGYVQ